MKVVSYNSFKYFYTVGLLSPHILASPDTFSVPTAYDEGYQANTGGGRAYHSDNDVAALCEE